MFKIIVKLLILWSLVVACNKSDKIQNCHYGFTSNFEILAEIDFYNYESAKPVSLEFMNLNSIFYHNGTKYIALNDWTQNNIWLFNTELQRVEKEFQLPKSETAVNPFVINIINLDSIIYLEYEDLKDGYNGQSIVLANWTQILRKYPLDYTRKFHKHLITEQGVPYLMRVDDYFLLRTWSKYGIPGHNSDSLMDARQLVYLFKIENDTLQFKEIPIYAGNYRDRVDGKVIFEQGVNAVFNPKINQITVHYKFLDTLFHYNFHNGDLFIQSLQHNSVTRLSMKVDKNRSRPEDIISNFPYVLGYQFFYCSKTNRYLRFLGQSIFDAELQKKENATKIYYIEYLDSDFNFIKCTKLEPNQQPIINNHGFFIKEINYESGLLTIYRYTP